MKNVISFLTTACLVPACVVAADPVLPSNSTSGMYSTTTIYVDAYGRAWPVMKSSVSPVQQQPVVSRTDRLAAKASTVASRTAADTGTARLSEPKWSSHTQFATLSSELPEETPATSQPVREPAVKRYPITLDSRLYQRDVF
jgi:hypothetical protein